MSSTYTDKNSPFSLLTNKHSQFGTFPNRAAIGCSQIAFPIIVLPKDDRTDSAQEEHCSSLDHDLGHLCRGRRIQMSGHFDFGNFQQFRSIFHFC